MKFNRSAHLVALALTTLLLPSCNWDDLFKKKEAPVKLIKSDFKPNEVTELCDAAIKKADDRLNAIGKLEAKDRKIDNSLLALEETLADLSDDTAPLTFMGYVSTDEAISAEGSACEEKLGTYLVGVSARRDLYQAIVDLKGRSKAEKRLLSETIRGFEESGLKLSDEKLAQLTELKKQLTEIETKFSTNLNQDKSSVVFTAEELDGAPASFLGRLKKTEDDKFIVTTKSTDYVDVIQNVKNSETRRKIMLAYQNRGGEENVKLLEQATQLRLQIANVMGYDTWADLRTHSKMAKNKENVLNFLNGLKDKLAERNRSDLGQLLKFKQELDPSANELNQWDIGYLSYQLQKRDYQLDNEEIRQYFPAEQVISGMFAVYSQLLGVKYVEVKDAKVWAEGVKLFEIRDATDNDLIAYFYADFIPRAGKYGHAAAFSLISGRKLSNGAYSYPVSSIVANFTPPSNGKPSLLTHDEVETTFHEFGHIMHQTLTRAPYASLSGTAVARDFVEAPSQMLENWVWSPEILSKISGHYTDPNKKLPQALLDNMLKAKNFQQAYGYTKQLLYATFDMTIHTAKDPVDVTATYNNLHKQLMGIDAIPGNHFAAGFGHMMGGYDAGYYGYLWSEVYAQDMFSKFESEDILSSKLGHRYRRTILESGSMREAIDLLKDFLGREPNSDAFFKKLGI